MGEAKQRGSLEERRENAIRQKAIKQEELRIKRRQDVEAFTQLTDSEKAVRINRQMTPARKSLAPFLLCSLALAQLPVTELSAE